MSTRRLPTIGLALQLVCLATASSGQQAGNLIANSSFEIVSEEGPPADWVVSANGAAVSLQKSQPPHGRLCLHFSLDGRETQLGQRSYFKLTPGKTMTLSAHVKAKDLQPAGGFQVLLINLGWSLSYPVLPAGGPTPEWKRYEKTFTVPEPGAFKYNNMDNVEYMVVMYAKGVRGEAWVDAIQLEESPTATQYRPMSGESSGSGDVVFDAVAADMKARGMAQSTYYEVKDPLFEELLGGEKGPDRVLYYGYDDLWPEERLPRAKKFGYRCVMAELRKEVTSLPLIPMTNGWERGGVGGYPTMRMILRPDVKDIAPSVIDDGPWIMDPRWLSAYEKAAARLAEQSLDTRPGNKWGNTWGLWAGDEVFESTAIKVPPKDKRYPEVLAADKEIREKYGFGKFGMPDSDADANPFARIAHRRWVNDKLTELYKKTYADIKRINPKLHVLGPDPCGIAPPVDMEAMSPYFDIFPHQAWYSPRSFVWKLATGADAKAVADLCSCPVWTLAQPAAAFDPEEIREQYSQVFRNGAAGLVLLGVEWYDRELEHVKLVNPAKWRAMLEVVDVVTRMNRLKLPAPDTAMLYASDTYLAQDDVKMASDKQPQVYAAYAALGPLAGSWFRFVSDRQIDRGQRRLADYKVLYIPWATYQRAAVLDKIEQYVADGGIVVCSDPTAFTWDITGEDLSARWLKLTGVRKGKPRTGPTTARFAAAEFPKLDKELTISFPAQGFEVSPADPSIKPLGLFGDGAIAATIRSYGKGRVIFFASDPFASQDRNTPVAELVKAIQLSAGAKVGHDIWRFKLPPFKTVNIEETETQKCLTGNHVVLERNEVKLLHDLPTGGTYTYDRFPTGIADVAGSGEIPFSTGRLTNRKAAYEGRKLGGDRNPPELEKWIVSWKDKGSVAITVDLKKPYAPARLRLVYCGELGAVKVEGGSDLKSWTPCGAGVESSPAAAETDVVDVTVPLTGTCRYLRIALPHRAGDRPLELCEMELWGNEAA